MLVAGLPIAADWVTDRQTDRQTERQTDRQTYRQTDSDHQADLSILKPLASEEAVLRSDPVRRQPLPSILAGPTVSTGELTGLLIAENLQLWDSEAGAVRGAGLWSLEEGCGSASLMGSSSGTVRILGKLLLPSELKMLSGGLHSCAVRLTPLPILFTCCKQPIKVHA